MRLLFLLVCDLRHATTHAVTVVQNLLTLPGCTPSVAGYFNGNWGELFGCWVQPLKSLILAGFGTRLIISMLQHPTDLLITRPLGGEMAVVVTMEKKECLPPS